MGSSLTCVRVGWLTCSTSRSCRIKDIVRLYENNNTDSEVYLLSTCGGVLPEYLYRCAAIMQDVREELTCPICMDLFSEPRRLPCGHVYCRGCLQDMLMKKYLNSRTSERVLSCPECRQHYDLTLQVAGVDIFPRDFKLMRLVELCKRAGGGSRRASDSEEETAVKTVCQASECESATTTSAQPSSVSASNSATADQLESADRGGQSRAPNSLTREQLEAGLVTFGTPASSLSDDSWIYVPGHDLGPWSARAFSLGPSPNNLGPRAPVRGDDSWLLPSNDFRFPLGSGSDYHGYFRDGEPSSLNSDINVSGRFDNVSRVDSQRFALNETATHSVSRPTAPHVETSESSSETDTESDDRGDEERSGDDDLSNDGQSRRQRRSRLSRFFRSLVMSDSDSWDEEEGQGSLGALGGSFQLPQPSHCNLHPPLLGQDLSSQHHLHCDLHPPLPSEGLSSQHHSHCDLHPPLPAQGLSSRGHSHCDLHPPLPAEGLSFQHHSHCDLHPPLPAQGLSSQGHSHQGDGPACLAPSEHVERFHGHYLRHGTHYHSHPHGMHMFSEPNLRVVRNAGAPLPSSVSQIFHVRSEAVPSPAFDHHALVFEGQSSVSSQRNPSYSGPVLGLSESPAVLPNLRLAEGHARSADPADVPTGQDFQSEMNKCCDSNHNAVPEVDLGQGVAAILAASDAASSTAEAVAMATSNASQATMTFGASRRALDGSDDSGDDYEAQTSMLHPRRKPRSRLKKFFTSLLSLSSSEDDDDDEVIGQIMPSVTSAPAPSVLHQ